MHIEHDPRSLRAVDRTEVLAQPRRLRAAGLPAGLERDAHKVHEAVVPRIVKWGGRARQRRRDALEVCEAAAHRAVRGARRNVAKLQLVVCGAVGGAEGMVHEVKGGFVLGRRRCAHARERLALAAETHCRCRT